jgi:transcriptional regulator with XRE-family HTH domain
MARNEITLGDLVRKARKERKLSARKLAELCEVSHTEINNIEKGIRVRPAVLTLKGFEKYLGLDYAELCRLVGYSEDTIKYGDENIIVSYEKYDKILQDYRKEIEHCAYLIEAKRRCGQEIKESFDVVCKYIDTLDNVPEEVKKEIKWIYRDLESIDLKYESLMQER